MTKVNPDIDIIPVKWEKFDIGVVPLLFCLCCGLTLTGCRTLATEVKAKLCIVEPGVSLPPECLTPVGGTSKEARNPELE